MECEADRTKPYSKGEYKGYCKGRKDTENKFKEAIKKLKKRMFEDEDPIIVIEEIFGKELCSEEESE